MSDDDEDVPPRAPRWRGLLLPAAALAIGALAGAGASLALGKPSDATAEEPAAHGEPSAKHDGGEGHGNAKAAASVQNLGSFTINLKGGGGGRVLRMEVQVEAKKGGAKVEANQALLRDAVITLVSDYTWADVEGLEGKTRLRDELMQRMNALLPDPVIDRVYFTDFVVQ